MARRGYTLAAVLLLLGAGLLGWDGAAVAQRPDRPWQPAPDPPGVIAQTPSKVVPPTHTLDAVATPVPGLTSLQVIASTKAPGPAAPRPAPIVRVSAMDGPVPAVGNPVGTSAPAPRPVLENRTAVVPPVERPAASEKMPSGQSAAVEVETIGPSSVTAGVPFTFEIVVRNPGNMPAQFVRVQDQLPANLQYKGSEPRAGIHDGQLLWNLGTLEPGAERHIKVEVQAKGEGEITSTATATCSARKSFRANVSQPRLSIVKKGPETAHVGDTVKFELLVSNLGSAPVEKVVLRDRMPEGLQHKAQQTPGEPIEADLGTLAPGQTKTITMEAKAVKDGRFVNEASVSAPGIGEVTARAAVVVMGASLTLRMSGPEQSNPNEDLDYALVVTNTGSGAAGGVKLSDTLAEGLDFVSASDGGRLRATTRSIEWDLGDVAPGQSRAVSARVKAIKAGDWKTSAVAGSARGEDARAEAAVHVEGVPALRLEVTALDDPVEVGAETTYEVHVANQGTAPSTNLKVMGILPAGLEVLGAEGPAHHRVQGNQVIFEPLSQLAAKADAIFKVRVKALKAGDWRFRAWLSSDHMPRPIYQERNTQVYSGADDPGSQQEINKR